MSKSTEGRTYKEFVRDDCPVCGHRGWCGAAEDGSVVFCRRQPDGATFVGTDKNGAPYYVHARDEPGWEQPRSSKKASADAPGPRPEPALVEIRDQVYTRLLEILTLDAGDREQLQRRGLNDAEIEVNGYRTLVSDKPARKALLEALTGEFGRDLLLSVPGFMAGKDGNLALAAVPGLLIPVRDLESHVVALKVKPSKRHFDGAGKYIYVSSARHGGPSPGAPYHVPLGPPRGGLPNSSYETVRLTEGELKADVATRLGGMLTISAPGVANWRAARQAIEALGCRVVRVAFDADATINPLVAQATVDCCRGLGNAGFQVEVERWAWKHGKGIDDVLQAGKPVEVIRGSAVAEYLDSLLPNELLSKKPGVAIEAIEPPDADDAIPIPQRPWPAPPAEAVYHGLAGDIVRQLEPHTEADPLGMLVQLLVMFGSAVGRSPHYLVEDTRHGCNEFVVQVGDSAVGRKGTATDRALAMFSIADPGWARGRVRSGLSSGEGLISSVRDPLWCKQPIKTNGKVVDYQDVMIDGGVDDKRLLALESEFGGVLRVLDREGNRLSALLRQAWDTGTLASLTKNPLKATDAHISIIGHITADELIAHLSRVNMVNGLANRFLWIAVRRSKVLPFGGRPKCLPELAARLTKAVADARDVGHLAMTPGARALWESSYARLTTPPPGKLGAVTSRAAPHAIRLAMLYALLAGSAFIEEGHLGAALALWQASAECAAFIFGESLGNPDAEKILRALRATESGLTRSQIRERVFQKNVKAERIAAALGYLLEHGMVSEQAEETGGRRAHRYYAINAKNAKSPSPSTPGEVQTHPYGVNGVNGVNSVNGVGANGNGVNREVIEL